MPDAKIITVRKLYGPTAHRAASHGSWSGAPLFEWTLCGRKIEFGEWAEVTDGTGWNKIVGHGPGYLLQPCTRCENAERAGRTMSKAERNARVLKSMLQDPQNH